MSNRLSIVDPVVQCKSETLQLNLQVLSHKFMRIKNNRFARKEDANFARPTIVIHSFPYISIKEGTVRGCRATHAFYYVCN